MYVVIFGPIQFLCVLLLEEKCVQALQNCSKEAQVPVHLIRSHINLLIAPTTKPPSEAQRWHLFPKESGGSLHGPRVLILSLNQITWR